MSEGDESPRVVPCFCPHGAYHTWEEGISLAHTVCVPGSFPGPSQALMTAQWRLRHKMLPFRFAVHSALAPTMAHWRDPCSRRRGARLLGALRHRPFRCPIRAAGRPDGGGRGDGDPPCGDARAEQRPSQSGGPRPGDRLPRLGGGGACRGGTGSGVAPYRLRGRPGSTTTPPGCGWTGWPRA